MIYLVRHGDAVPEATNPERPLSEKGRAEVEVTAIELLAQGAKVDEIWHSPKQRARQTAEILARALKVSKVIEKEELKPDDSVIPIAELLKKTQKNILIAGHLPFIPKLAVLLKPKMKDKKLMELGSGEVVRITI